MSLKFKGTHISEIPAYWKTLERPIIPPAKSFYEDCPETDGQHDFSESNDDGRVHFNDRVFKGTLTVVEKDPAHLQYALSKVANWLAGGWGELIFDDMPTTVWMAKVENAEAAANEINRIGSATVYFRVKSFSNWIYNSQSGGIQLDDPILIEMASIPLDQEFNATYDFADNTNIAILNWGDRHTKPVIEITGNFNWVNISCSGRNTRYSGNCGVGDTVIINCQECIVTKNGVNSSINSSGNFIELSHGSNSVNITSNGSGQAKFIFNYKFIYGAVV